MDPLSESNLITGTDILQGSISLDRSKYPSGYSTTIYDSDGNMMHKLVGKNANRIYVTIDEIPQYVQDAFVAIEDARFYEIGRAHV